MRNYKPYIIIILIFSTMLFSCKETVQESEEIVSLIEDLNLEQANRLAELPLKCIQNEMPYKSGLTISKEEDLQLPIVHHPAFYGCFDWHSAVHGHWSLVYLMKEFPNLERMADARKMLDANLTKANIEKEIAYFSLNNYTKSFERTYGWAWLLKLSEELYTWDDPDAQRWYENLKPLNALLSEKYIEYLPKLVYPIRVGEHSNTAFGLTFALDYARTVGDKKLEFMIVKRAKEFYLSDSNCPIEWEPSGYDFLSPCLEEMDIMRRVLKKEKFDAWSSDFLPNILNGVGSLAPGKVFDRSDGKLVHLDGLNFSRAWCLYPIENMHTTRIADEHLSYSLVKITDGDYAGEHWLASFALYALKTKSGK